MLALQFAESRGANRQVVPGNGVPGPCTCSSDLLHLLLAALLGSSCGYVGEPLPPALHIPQRVADLSAIERGAQIHVQFTLPTHTTESLDIRTPVRIELRVGSAGQPFDLASWEAGAKIFADIPADQSAVKYDLSAAEWIGKDVVLAVRIFGANGRTAGWSNLFTLSVVPPLAAPAHLQAADVREGVRLTWQGEAPRYRIYRRAGEEPNAKAIGETERPEYNDNATDYGTPYHYSVEGFRTGGDIHLRQRSFRGGDDHYPRHVRPDGAGGCGGSAFHRQHRADVGSQHGLRPCRVSCLQGAR